MANMIAITIPIIIGINGILLIALEIIDSVYRKKGQKEQEKEKEREEIKARWDQL
ncbi:hypothetical protein [Dorea sp. D27]|uniref:hypothetical protein n=1 Tax=Dorea sp. D27 TaxID=658665 RepID=UPI0006A09094|nr:hypothetical protein [Dorea sp. D27]KMZ52716.1 hypothetical protein HMPREF0980_03159 [Dorea sp. D27]